MDTSAPIVFIVDDDGSIDSAFGRLVDVSMKGMHGLALQQAVAKSERSYPVIFLTGDADVHTCATARKMGAIDFPTKLCGTAALYDAVERAIRLDVRARESWARRSEAERRMPTLTPREREVMTLVISGNRNKQIAYRLGCSVRTVKVHIRMPEQPTIAPDRGIVLRGLIQPMQQFAI